MIANAKIVAVDADPAQYHGSSGKRGTANFQMSASAMREFMRCPDRWRRGFDLPSNRSLRFGSLVDAQLLAPQFFEKRYAIRPDEYTNEEGETKPWHSRSNTCREWLAEHDGLEVVSKDEVEEGRKAIASLVSDEVAANYIKACDCQVWVAAEWLDKPTGVTVPIRCLIDLAPRKDTEFAMTLGDLKTTSNAAQMAWQRFCYSTGYHIQAAWNLALYNAATGDERDRFCFLLVENVPPYQPAKRMLHADFLGFAQQQVKRLMSAYCGCIKTGRWPGYDDTDEAVQGWGIVNAEPWMESAETFGPKFDFEPECEQANDPAWMANP